MKNPQVSELKKLIKQYEYAQRVRRAEAHELHGPQRHARNQERKAWRPDGRALLLAYAFLRGVPYIALEARTYTSLNLEAVASFAQTTESCIDAWRTQPVEVALDRAS